LGVDGGGAVMPVALDGYTFRLGDEGVVLNADASLPFVDVTRIIGFDSAEARETERDWEGNDGGFMDAEFERGRRIILEGKIYCDVDDVETYLDALKENWAVSRTLVPLYLKAPGVVERILFVKPLGVKYDWETARRYGETAAQFLCYAEDPRFYSTEEFTIDIDLNLGTTTGFAFNFGFNFDFGVAVAGLGTNAFNHGNRPTPFVLTFFGPTTNPRILNDDTGAQMDFEIDLASDQSLVVDTKYRTVRLDGVTNRRNALIEPSWFFLQKGNNHLRYFSDSIVAVVANVTYRSAWR
jgi:hypothetical protein